MSDSSSSNVATTRNAIASSADWLGLTKAALETINSSSPVMQLTKNIVSWLGRERISESDFKFFIEQSRGIAYPNEYGLSIREDIQRNENKIAKVGGIHLIAAGAIGRWMAFSEDHAYMVTTVAVITKLYGLGIARGFLCDMILYDRHQSALKDFEISQRWSVERARLKGVIFKIVDSIALNVVNPGHCLGDMPYQLKSLCVHSISGSTNDLVEILTKILRSNADTLLLCDRFLGVVFLWIRAHFEGNIEVSVGGRKVFRSDGNFTQRKFSMNVNEVCTQDCREESGKWYLAEFLDGKWITAVQGIEKVIPITPLSRHPLYSLDAQIISSRREVLNREELYNIKVVAQRTVAWMMDIPLKPGLQPRFFQRDRSERHANPSLRLGDIMYRCPQIIHEVNVQSSPFIPPEIPGYHSPELESYDSDDSSARVGVPDQAFWQKVQPVFKICECFPALFDVSKRVMERCKCPTCRNAGPINDCKVGCLREATVNRFFWLFGNAVADGLGIPDVSGFLDFDQYVYAVRFLLLDLIDGKVDWDRWFNVAASTVLGYPCQEFKETSQATNSTVAVQYGSMTAAAKWLDLTQNIRSRGCFAVEIAEGVLPNVNDTLAFIHSAEKVQTKPKTSSGMSFSSFGSPESWLSRILEEDSSIATMRQAITAWQHPKSMRLITIVGTDACQRIIDPADALNGIIHAEYMNLGDSPCNHGDDNALDEAFVGISDPANWYLWSFDDLLAEWDDNSKARFFTVTLNTELKLNVAMAMVSRYGAVIREVPSCLQCSILAGINRGDRQGADASVAPVVTCKIKDETLTRYYKNRPELRRGLD
ncbi:MAG: hypothetical protein Q9174_002428 [Haloplaca sp. 1 TL-2023]